MARVFKFDKEYKKRFERKEKKRAINIKNKLVYFLIVCEGAKTEPNYFSSLNKELPRNTVDLKIMGVGLNTLGLIEYTINARNSSIRHYDRVWVVFDKDDFPDRNFNDAIAKATSQQINCAWSNEAFELWFLLHFQFVNTAMNREDYKSYLEREIQKKSGRNDYKYLKNDASTYSILKAFGDQKQAIEWAKVLKQLYSDQRYATHNPCTLVYELIEELFNPNKVLITLENNENPIENSD